MYMLISPHHLQRGPAITSPFLIIANSHKNKKLNNQIIIQFPHSITSYENKLFVMAYHINTGHSEI